jgi:hypothetical protein
MKSQIFKHITISSLLILMVIGGFVRDVSAQVGGAAVVFLMIEPDSRAAGMGNAGVAIADNANALFWNPAGLADQVGTEVALTHSNWLPELSSDLFFEYLVGKHHIKNWGTIGAHVTFLNLGEHEHRDALNVSLGTFRSYDLSVGVSYGFKVSEYISLGTGVRWIRSNLASVNVGAQESQPGVSVGVDLAAMLKMPEFRLGSIATRYNIGFNLANMGPKIQYSDSEQADPIPTLLRIGHALTFQFDDYNKITFANDASKILVRTRVKEVCLDINDPATCAPDYSTDPFYRAIFTSWTPIEVLSSAVNDDEQEYQNLSVIDQLLISAGFEYWYNDLFAARGGYFYENPYNGNREFLTFGAGIRYNIVGVDFSYVYALEENHPLANTMRFSLLLNFAR